MGVVATSPLRGREYRTLQIGGPNLKWPTSGPSGYITPTVLEVPNTSKRGGGGIKSGPEVGLMATSPVPSKGSLGLQTWGQNQKCPTSGPSGYITPAISGVPNASEWGIKSKLAHKWA